MLKLQSPENKAKQTLVQKLKAELSTWCYNGKNLMMCEEKAKIWASARQTIHKSKFEYEQAKGRAVQLSHTLNRCGGMIRVTGVDLINMGEPDDREQHEKRKKLLTQWCEALYGHDDHELISQDLGLKSELDVPQEVTKQVLAMKAEFDQLSYQCLQAGMRLDLANKTNEKFTRQVKVDPLPRRCANLRMCADG